MSKPVYYFVLLCAAALTACGDTDELSRRTLPEVDGGSGSEGKVGNRDTNAQASDQTQDEELAPGVHTLFLSTLRSDADLPKDIELQRGDKALRLEKELKRTEPSWEKACSDDCEISVKQPKTGAVVLMSVKNTGHDSMLIGYFKQAPPSSTAADDLVPDVVVEAVCRECDTLKLEGASSSQCANIRAMWLNGDDCVASN